MIIFSLWILSNYFIIYLYLLEIIFRITSNYCETKAFYLEFLYLAYLTDLWNPSLNLFMLFCPTPILFTKSKYCDFI